MNAAAMTDSDYIQPAERPEPNTHGCGAYCYGGASAWPGFYESLLASHVVADSVMRDLAEALRALIKPVLPTGVAGISFPMAETALARFDALNGDKP